MKSSRSTAWCIFAVCVLLVAGVMGWATSIMQSLEQRERLARHETQRQETLRLALWRMDSTATPLIAQESARPYFEYRAFYPAERAYTRMWEEVLPGEVLVPSPLLRGAPGLIRLHFEIDEAGRITSPQAPTGNMRDRAEGQYIEPESVMRAEQLLLELAMMIEEQGLEHEAEWPPKRDEGRIAAERAPAAPSEAMRGPGVHEAAPMKAGGDYMARQLAFEQALNVEQKAPTRQEELVQRRQLAIRGIATGADRTRAALDAAGEHAAWADTEFPAPNVSTGPFEPVWRVDPASGRRELLFLRTVSIDDRRITQGFWVDWPRLRDTLIGRIVDLLPAATLEPVSRGGLIHTSISPAESGELLASIPAKLIPSLVPEALAPAATTLRVTLAVTWGAVLVAVVAIGLVLRASMAISERRGRFVSAVTHELRTPMTTFCLYSQMLADGMIRDEQRRGEYLATLKQESQRLARIVENVLAFARLGRKQAVRARKGVALSEVLDRIRPTLASRAEQAGMTLVFEPMPGALEANVPDEREGIGRIVFNLVDNACKYASESNDKSIHLGVRIDRGRVVICVMDHGPGVPRDEERRIFAPFRRAKRDDASATPGLGLGLALARGMARELGGDLRLIRKSGFGAVFELALPVLPG
ncbi:MAG: HAMP domain-containing histidine kinase [Phycisphaeraceae bacterium]|nr:HAMP domain-containing histidine kinase [Phycisphaeraceae bacterium]